MVFAPEDSTTPPRRAFTSRDNHPRYTPRIHLGNDFAFSNSRGDGKTSRKISHPSSPEDIVRSVSTEPRSQWSRRLAVGMISIGGVIGTGLFVGSGAALKNGGPAGAFLGYAIIGSIVFSLCVSIGEMIAFLYVLTLARFSYHTM